MPSPGGIQNYGAVAYDFSIAKYDVTNSQYAQFLNLKDPTVGVHWLCTPSTWPVHLGAELTLPPTIRLAADTRELPVATTIR